MTLSTEYANYLTTFLRLAREQVGRQLEAGNYGDLVGLEVVENDDGVWVEVRASLAGDIVLRWGSETYDRRSLIINDDGPVDPADFAADLISAAVGEDLDTAGHHRRIDPAS
jgi:hypothetical protein